MDAPTSYRISVQNSQLEDLRQRLQLTRFPDELDNVAWDYGAPLSDIKRLTAYWKDGYDWRKHEAALNAELPQFTLDIAVANFGSLNIHFVHKKSDVSGAIPLCFVHGWPGSFLEVRKILPLLTSPGPGKPAFHVVAFSLPGYGFSEAPRQRGFSMPQFAEVGHKLMLTLGYDEYVTQGGDWGHLITRHMAHLYGSSVKAWHTNMNPALPNSMWKHPLYLLSSLYDLLMDRNSTRTFFQRSSDFAKHGRGYSEMQRTRPQTLGYSLADSPSGMLAWVYDKLVQWTDEYPWTDDEVLTWVSIYWFSRAGPAASVRVYREVSYPEKQDVFPRVKGVPMGLSYFPRELMSMPAQWMAATAGELVHVNRHDKGGHFAAYERPDDLVDDLREMFGKLGPCFAVVKGKSGY